MWKAVFEIPWILCPHCACTKIRTKIVHVRSDAAGKRKASDGVDESSSRARRKRRVTINHVTQSRSLLPSLTFFAFVHLNKRTVLHPHSTSENLLNASHQNYRLHHIIELVVVRLIVVIVVVIITVGFFKPLVCKLFLPRSVPGNCIRNLLLSCGARRG